MNNPITKCVINLTFWSLYVLSLVAVFLIVENRFEELEMQSMHTKCVVEELKDYDLCVTKIENEYQRSL